METAEKTEQMRIVRDEVIGLKDSPLYKFRIKNKNYPVIGEGSHDADIMFIGEAPGKNEAETGKPFCGAAGKILDELLDSAKIARKDVYVTNIVKDRPPSNRDPLPEEIDTYAPFLDRQIEIIRPKAIATLGRFSMVYIMKKFNLDAEITPISTAHGKIFDAQAQFGTIKIVPLYHPAATLYNPSLKEELKKDFEVLKEIV